MTELQREHIEQLLQELGDELGKKFSEPVKIMLIGGAYMLLMLHNRPSTQDIDFYPLNVPDSTQPNKDTRRLFAAIRAIGKRYGLSRD